MKTVIFTFLAILLLASTIDARSITETIKVGESIVIEDQNVTVMDTETKGDKVLLCVNGVKSIVSDEKDRTVNNVFVSVSRVKEFEARLKLESRCDECTLNNNVACYDECSQDSDCNDDDEKTQDSCIGAPKKCFYTEITEPTPNEPTPEEPTEHNIVVNLQDSEPERKDNIITRFFSWIASIF
tara:strand:+ start:384 stop:935 length:552 start_codon:yes stop_codon:yes gene_type:complete